MEYNGGKEKENKLFLEESRVMLCNSIREKKE